MTYFNIFNTQTDSSDYSITSYNVFATDTKEVSSLSREPEDNDDDNSFSSLLTIIQESMNQDRNESLYTAQNDYSLFINVAHSPAKSIGTLSQGSTYTSQNSLATDAALYEPHPDPDDEDSVHCYPHTPKQDVIDEIPDTLPSDYFSYSTEYNNTVPYYSYDYDGVNSTGIYQHDNLSDTQPYESDTGATSNYNRVSSSPYSISTSLDCLSSSFIFNSESSSTLQLLSSANSTESIWDPPGVPNEDEFNFFDPITEDDVLELDKMVSQSRSIETSPVLL